MADQYIQGAVPDIATKNIELGLAYDSAERGARRLSPDQALDMRDGRPLPYDQRITKPELGYVLIVKTDDSAIACLPLDDKAQALAQEPTLDKTALDPRLVAKIDSSPLVQDPVAPGTKTDGAKISTGTK